MTDMSTNRTGYIPYETFIEPNSFGFPFPGGGSSVSFSSSSGTTGPSLHLSPLAICDDTVSSLRLAAPESLGMTSEMQMMGLGPMTAFLLNKNLGGNLMNIIPKILSSIL